jgi:predicted nucleotidyltransferase component of viral defense system
VISRFDLDERVREWGLSEEVVEKDYLIGWVLWGIGSHGALARGWAFKGGTCLKKCYLETYRFSEDLDFTVLPGGPFREEELQAVFSEVLGSVYEQSGIVFSDQAPRFRTHPTGNYTDGRIYYRGPRGSPTVASLRIDLNVSEKLARPVVLRRISHAYPDSLPEPATVPCYSFEEVFAEKIRAMGERGRPRDLYDIVNLFRRDDLRSDAATVRRILIEKCESKGIDVPTLDLIERSPYRAELEQEWANMLAHQLPQLPPFESFWGELPHLFAWLGSAIERPRLNPIPTGEAIDTSWRLPSTVSTWGVSVPVEAIRFAASNHLCVLLGYKGTVREVEPYSFRRSKAGDILFCGIKAESREVRAYRLDRIQSVRVSQRSFTPQFEVEIGATGPLGAPPVARTRTRSATRSRRSRR